MTDRTTKLRFDLGSPDGATELESHVQSCLSGQLRDFHIDLRAEGLLLQGSALTHRGRLQAEQEVQDATGLPIFANEIEVISPRQYGEEFD